MRKDILNSLLFILIISSCNSLDPISNNLNDDENNNDSSENIIDDCENCIYSYDFEILTLGVGPEGEIVDDPKVPAAYTVKRSDSIYYQGIIGIEIRGESSQNFDKKSYGLETWDEQYNDIDVPLLGLPEEEDWILYGPFSDKSLLRNKLIYELSNQMGRYAVKTEFVELTINYDYKGLYIFMEKLKRDKSFFKLYILI